MSVQRSPKAALVYFILGAAALGTLLGLCALVSTLWCIVAIIRWIGG